MSTGLPRTAAVTMLAILLATTASAQSEPKADDTSGSASGSALRQTALDDPWSAVEPQFPDRENRLLQRRSTESASPVLAKTGERSQRPWARTLAEQD